LGGNHDWLQRDSDDFDQLLDGHLLVLVQITRRTADGILTEGAPDAADHFVDRDDQIAATVTGTALSEHPDRRNDA
jgi:hypothetical protein